MSIYQEKLFALQDRQYAEFQSKLTPNVPKERFIGVRVPEIRKLAKTLIKETDISQFLDVIPHQYYDEDMLHGLIISELKDYDACMKALERFLPYVDNWAVCDIMSPKVFKKNKEKLIETIPIWISSTHVYTCRFGMEMLMTHFLDTDFKEQYLELPAGVQSEEYYVNMMIAWFFATALAKQWETTIQYLENDRLNVWTHNKTIQKAKESYRITDEQKQYLNTLKR